MNTGNLIYLASVLHESPERGSAGEILTGRLPWKEVEKMWVGEVKYGRPRPLLTTSRDAASIERCFESWARPTVVKEGVQLVVEGVTYTVTRVDPEEGKRWMYVYCIVAK